MHNWEVDLCYPFAVLEEDPYGYVSEYLLNINTAIPFVKSCQNFFFHHCRMVLSQLLFRNHMEKVSIFYRLFEPTRPYKLLNAVFVLPIRDVGSAITHALITVGKKIHRWMIMLDCRYAFLRGGRGSQGPMKDSAVTPVSFPDQKARGSAWLPSPG